ncbi:MAG TPA: Calx-beta domain-containing protein [Panacibacter sp.]|nr:Calx-beta domain-containing protein [Panacibacter sp.]
MKTITTLTSFIFIVNFSFAQPGSLDSSFGVNGTIINIGIGRANCTALQADGKILVAGTSNTSFNNKGAIIARYKFNGVLDSAFGVNGIVLTDLEPGFAIKYAQANVLLIQNNGQILIVGNGSRDNGTYGNYNVILVRYNIDGSLDTGFGNKGVVVSDFFDDNDFGRSAAIQPDGKIIVAGESGGTVLLARYNSDGTPDLPFGIYGYGWIKKLNTGPAYSLALQTDGRIVVGGINRAGNGDRFMVSRFQSNGKTDSSFGTNGSVYTDFGVGGDYLEDIALQADGKIIGTGKAGGAPGQEGSICMIRYFANGAIDTSFGTGGKVLTEIPAQFSTGKKLLLTNDKIFVAARGEDFILVSYTKDGALNQQFGQGGIQLTDMGGDENASDAALQPDGKIVIAGSQLSAGDYNSFALARYTDILPITISFKKNEKVVEGNTGITKANFKIILSQPSSKDISVNIATKDGTAIAGSDYKAKSGTVTIKAGQTSKNIEVNIIGDSIKENNEKFSLVLSNPVNAILGEHVSAECTIKNDDILFALNTSSKENIESQNSASVKIFPNPVKDNLQLSGLSIAANTTLVITDVSGNRRLAAEFTGSSYNLNISQLKAGSYILRIENGGEVVSKMFVKE